MKTIIQLHLLLLTHFYINSTNQTNSAKNYFPIKDITGESIISFTTRISQEPIILNELLNLKRITNDKQHKLICFYQEHPDKENINKELLNEKLIELDDRDKKLRYSCQFLESLKKEQKDLDKEKLTNIFISECRECFIIILKLDQEQKEKNMKLKKDKEYQISIAKKDMIEASNPNNLGTILENYAEYKEKQQIQKQNEIKRIHNLKNS